MSIDDERLAAFAEVLVTEQDASGDPPDPPTPWLVRPDPGAGARTTAQLERAVATAVVLDTVNFGSGWHPVLRKRPGCSGATTVAAGVREWLDAGETHARRFAALGADDLARICGQAGSDPAVATLMAAFADALGELGRFLLETTGGRVLPLVEQAGGSAAAFASLLATLPSYHDVSHHGGDTVALYKRAQLAAADVHRAGAGHPPARFDDLARLTAFADNLVPHVLRVEGVLVLAPDLAERIDAGVLLDHGSEEEVEIRALGVHAVERLSGALADRGVALAPCDLDAVLWARGGGRRFKAVPRPRSRCRAY